jgi:hypothetical protein
LTTAEHPEDTTLTWRKASRSNAGNNCVEIARAPVGYLIRDSKKPAGPRLPLRDGIWTTFIKDIRAGDYELKAASW